MWAEFVSYCVQSLFSSQASACLLALSTTTSLDHYQHEMLTRTLTWFCCLSYSPYTTTERLPPAPSYRRGTWSSELGSSLLNLGRMDLPWALHFCDLCMKQFGPEIGFSWRSLHTSCCTPRWKAAPTPCPHPVFWVLTYNVCAITVNGLCSLPSVCVLIGQRTPSFPHLSFTLPSQSLAWFLLHLCA